MSDDNIHRLHLATQQRMIMNQSNAPMIQWFQAWTKNSQSMTEGAQRLMRGQFERNAQAMNEMIGAGNFMKVMEVHERWVTGTMQSYSEEMRRTIATMQEIFGGSLGRIHEMARESMDESRPAHSREVLKKLLPAVHRVCINSSMFTGLKKLKR